MTWSLVLRIPGLTGNGHISGYSVILSVGLGNSQASRCLGYGGDTAGNNIIFDWFRFNRFNEHCTLEASEFVRLITTIAVIMLLTPHSCCRPNFRMLVCASVWVD